MKGQASGMTGLSSALVTGCTGTIGNALVRLLLQRGIRVYAVCRPSSLRRLYLPKAPLLHVIEEDLYDLPAVKTRVSAPCQAFFHLGWRASHGPDRDKAEAQAGNLDICRKAVRLAADLGCLVFVGAGSQAQYGDPGQILDESTPMRPLTAYGRTKLEAEILSRELCAAENIRHVWGRALSVYGPCDGPHTLITYIMRCMLRGEEAELTACEQSWDYLFADDAARAFLALAEKGGDRRAYCVAYGQSRPLRVYMEELRAALGPAARLRFGGRPYAPGQLMSLGADISALRADTGFAPRQPFADGIAATWRWYQDHPEAVEEERAEKTG